MNQIRRVIVSETLKVFLATTAVALLLMTLGGGAKEGISRGLPPQVVLQILPYIVPEMLRFVIPGCLLFAVCSVLGQMAAANEMVALKSLGIDPLRVIWPVLILAYALSATTFWLYDVCAVWARPNLRRLVSESIDEIAYSVLGSSHSFRASGVSIVVDGVKGKTLLRPVVTVETGKAMPPMTLTAAEARLVSDAGTGTLRIECRDGQFDVAGKGSLRFPDGFSHVLTIGDATAVSEEQLSPAYLGIRAIPRQVALERKQIARLERDLRSIDCSAKAAVDCIQRELEHRRARLFRLQAEPHRRLSNGLGCFCFALVGVPVAMGRRSADTMSVFFLCFLPILLVYYPLLMTGENIARQGVFPQCSVWLADAVLFSVGIVLLRYMRR
jgi:lipopolysaccharide export system permease protein